MFRSGSPDLANRANAYNSSTINQVSYRQEPGQRVENITYESSANNNIGGYSQIRNQAEDYSVQNNSYVSNGGGYTIKQA